MESEAESKYRTFSAIPDENRYAELYKDITRLYTAIEGNTRFYGATQGSSVLYQTTYTHLYKAIQHKYSYTGLYTA